MPPKADKKDVKKDGAKDVKKEVPQLSAKEIELDKREKELTKVPQPSRTEFDADMEKRQKIITDVQTKLQEAKNKIDSKGGNREEFTAKRDALKLQMDEHQKVCDGHDKQLAEIRDSVKKKFDESRSARAEVSDAKKKIGFESPEQIDSRIAQIEYEMHTRSLTLKQEKEMVKEIQDLKGQKPVLNKYTKMEGAAGRVDQSGVGELKAKEQGLWDALKAARTERGKVRAEYGALMDIRKKALEGTPELLHERDALQGQMKQLIVERNVQRDEFRAKNNEFSAYMNEVRAIRQERQREQWGRQQTEWASRQQAREASMEEEIPMLEELTLVEQTLVYVRSLKPVVKSTDDEKAVDVSAPGGHQALKCKDDRDEVFYYAPTKGKKAKNAKKKEDAGKPISHALGSLQLFAELKVKAPGSTADLDATIKALEAKEQEYKTKQANTIEERKKKKETRAAAIAAGETPTEEAAVEA